MKFLVTGATGLLGSDVMEELARRGYDAVGSSRSSGVPMDITDARNVRSVLKAERPDVVVNCAAWTAVDGAEDAEDSARAVNATGAKNLALACEEIGCKLIHISTDYVFDGKGDAPRKPEDETNTPVNVYGKTKLEGEQALRSILEKHFIVRIAWTFGRNGNNFVKTMLNLGKKYDSVRVVCDQIGTPTYTRDLAALLADMALTDQYGTYHATNEGGYISWYDFACEIFRQAGYDTKVIPVTTEEYGISRAKRPLNSRLCKEKLAENGFCRLPDWKDALDRYLKEIKESGSF